LTAIGETHVPAQEVEAVKELHAGYLQLTQQLHGVIVGMEDVIEQLMIGMLCRGHCILEGVPGLAKTMLVSKVADSLGLIFRRIQFTPDLMPADITGTDVLEEDHTTGKRIFRFLPGPLFGNVILADEINRTPPKTQSALLEAMQERQLTVGGTTYPLPQPFFVLATQNPIEQEGTYPLPEAQLDRFLLSIHIDYPSRSQELVIAARPPRLVVPDMEQVATADEFHTFVEVVEQGPVSDYVLEYAVSLTTASRPKDPSADEYVRNYVSWGVGPRCTQHLVMAAKATAILDGRPSPEIRDIREMAMPVLRHRILPNYSALGEGLDSADIVNHLLTSVGEPVGAR
jgi:MoxR-like ATPase